MMLGRCISAAVVLAALVAVACSGGDDGEGENGGTSGGLNIAGSSSVGGSGNGTGGSGPGSNGGAAASPGSCPTTAIVDGCVGEGYVGETIPLDIYIMFDQSGSMLTEDNPGTTRMNAVRSAVDRFLNDPGSAGISAGIGYFGTQPFGSASCNPADYDSAEVGIDVLPGHAGAIMTSLNGKVPTGETPTDAAIKGACTVAQAHKAANPGHETVMLFVTDGLPEAPVTCDIMKGTCCPQLPEAVKAAQDCLGGSPGIKTYVLGVGPLLGNLAEIARAGGTENAYLVEDGSSDKVLEALNAIRAAATIPCTLQIPAAEPGQSLDFTKVNVIQTTPACEQKTLYFRESADQCSPETGGWYFDSTAPSQIQLCASTCQEVAVPGSQLNFSIGCGRKVEIE